MMNYETGLDFSQKMDVADPLNRYREEFHIPKQKNGQDVIYFCGNSLGLQPKSTKEAIYQELEDWKDLGVEGHFQAKNPWLPYHEFLTEKSAKIVGAKNGEVVMMNTLTVNLHLMMVSFYQPTEKRHKIVIEGAAFPSDRYAVTSQIKFHGRNPDDSLIELMPRTGEDTIRTEDIEKLLAEEGDTISLIMIGGVNYYTGQLFDMERITKLGHDAGCIVAFDLAHATGNVDLKLHDWGVDFACWCSYKYLNSGPGSVSGCFVHERHADSPDRPRFSGWWGHDKETRFQMGPEFIPIMGAEGWQLSNPPILSLAAIKASLEIFDRAGMENLIEKSQKLTGYLEFLLNELKSDEFHIMTPSDSKYRGCQLSIVVHENGKDIFDALERQGVVCDWREPDCVRIAPVPLYNTYGDAYNFVRIFSEQLGQNNNEAKVVAR